MFELQDPRVIEADNILRRQQEVKEKIEGHQPKRRKNQQTSKQIQNKSKLAELVHEDDLQVIALKRSAVINNQFSQLVMDLVPEDKFSRIIKNECKIGTYEKPNFNIPRRVAEVVKNQSRLKLGEDGGSPFEPKNPDDSTKIWNRSNKGLTSDGGSNYYHQKVSGKTIPTNEPGTVSTTVDGAQKNVSSKL